MDNDNVTRIISECFQRANNPEEATLEAYAILGVLTLREYSEPERFDEDLASNIVIAFYLGDKIQTNALRAEGKENADPDMVLLFLKKCMDIAMNALTRYDSFHKEYKVLFSKDQLQEYFDLTCKKYDEIKTKGFNQAKLTYAQIRAHRSGIYAIATIGMAGNNSEKVKEVFTGIVLKIYEYKKAVQMQPVNNYIN